jgi:hypothetical protein
MKSLHKKRKTKRIRRWPSLLLVICAFLSTGHVLGQSAPWPPADWQDTSVQYKTNGRGVHFSYRNFKGRMVLNTGDTLSGYLRLYGSHCFLLQQGQTVPADKSPADIKLILADYGPLTVTLVNLHRYSLGRYFWRVLAKKGNVTIYDAMNRNEWNYANDLNRLGTSMVLYTGSRRIKLYGELSEFSYHPEKRLLEFINKHYQQSFQQQDFKTNRDMISYILDQENKNELR